MKLSSILLLGAVALAGDGWLDAARAADQPKIDGTWQVTRFDAATGHCFDGFRLILESDGMALRGRILWPSGKETPLAAGEVKEGRISFRATPGSMIQQYSGEFRGEGIHGKWAVGIASFDWKARRVPADAPADDAAGKAFREVEHEFVGVSDARSYDAALSDALRKMDKAVAERARFPCSKASWRVVEISGTSGTPAGLSRLEVKIVATFETRVKMSSEPNP